ncbi:MAG: hypothetical protein NC124_20085 [Clostridium sp.]|nr:hypothetical protein [Acetatifactor muris]MCM1500764.1 hypothetical protein [Clostridium sp.]
MHKRLKLYKMARFILLPLLLTACTQQEINEEQIIPSSIVESSTNVEKPENNPGAQQDVSTGNSSQDILTACAGTTIIQTIETSAGEVISIDAQVDVDGVSRVSRYKYIPLQFADEKREALLERMFPAESWDVNEAAMYNEKEGAWEIVTPRGERWVCRIKDSRISGEQIVNVERIDIALDYVEESEVSPIRLFNTPAEDQMLLIEVTNCSTSEIIQIGKLTATSVTEEIEYVCDYIHICEEDSGHPYAKAVFKQMVDGMPVTAWHDFSTATSKGSILPVKAWGSFFSMEEIGLAVPILTPTEAVAAMQEQIDSIQMQETQMYVTKISLEYLAVISSNGELEIVPIWRFWPGNDELERIKRCELIFAVDAVNGELIWENREAFTG